MTRLGGPTGGAAAFALTAGLAFDDGGFQPVSWNRALVGVAALTLVLAILADGRRPGPFAAALLGALAALTLWTAASWFWSLSPPAAPQEAQRVALYLAVAAAVVVAGRNVPPRWLAAGVAAGATLTAAWNLGTRVHGVGAPVAGALAQPVGYENGLALLCVLGLAVLPALPPPAWTAAAPLAADLVVQKSTGADVALGAAALAWAFVLVPRARALLAAAALAAAIAVPLLTFHGHERGQYWHVALQEAHAHPVLGSGAGTFVDWWLRERTVSFSTREAHSLYLETLAELGPLGLALLLVALTAPLAAAWRLRSPALAAAVLAYDVGAGVDFHWELAAVTVPAILLGASACVHASCDRGPLPRLVAVPALVALTAAGVLALAGNAPLADASDANTAGRFAAAAADATRALRFAPFSSEAWRQLALARAALGDPGGARDAYRRALALDPADASLWLGLASVSRGQPRRSALAEAARLNPLGDVP